MLNLTDSHLLTIPHDLHRQRRKPLEPVFSRSGIRRFEPMLAEFIKKLVCRFDALKGTASIVRLDHAFLRCLAMLWADYAVGQRGASWMNLKSLLSLLLTRMYWSKNFEHAHSISSRFDMYLGFVRSVNLLTGLPFLIRYFTDLSKQTIPPEKS